MRRSIVIGVLVLLGVIGGGAAAPSHGGSLVLASISEASAAISRGGGEGEEGGASPLQVGGKSRNLLVGWIGPLIFVVAAILVGVAAGRRDTGAAAIVIAFSLVIGALVFVPDLVKSLFISIYQYVL